MSARALALAALLSCAPLPARAQGELPREVDLSTLLSLVERRSPLLSAERATIGLARAEVVQAGVHPNPEFEYLGFFTLAGSNDAWNGHQSEFWVGQPLLLADQIGVRERAAHRRVAAASARVESVRAELALEARRAFVALLAAQARVTAIEEATAELERLAELVRARAQAGDRSRYDALRVELELVRLRAAREDARADVVSSAGALAALVGAPGWAPRARGDLAARTPDLALARWERARTRSPRLEAARRELAAARAGVEAAHRDAVPVPVLSGGGGFTTDASAGAAFVGLTIPLPLFDRNQGGIARAEAEVEVAHEALDAITRTMRARIVRASRVLAARYAALERFEREVLAALPALREMAEQSYRGGQTSVLELIDSVRSLREVSLERVDRLAAVREAELDLLEAAGVGAPPR